MPAAKVVDIRNMQYVPAKITIELGESVVWTNHDAMTHTATRVDSPAFDTGALTQNQTSAEIVFSELSDDNGFGYFCKPHPFMQGSVIVKGKA
jgi:amicyanin